MSASASKLVLSGSTNGRPIKVAATSSPGTTVHTVGAATSTAGCEEIWIWATNTSTSPVLLTVQWGGTTSPDDYIYQTIPAQAGLYLVAQGQVLQNSLVVKAFAATTNVINITGYANKITN